MAYFVTESYTMLQTDSGSEMVSLLRQVVAANYTVTANYVNSTVPVPVNPTSKLPLWALHVNELWFASLICSLATASIGILVKQWLKEYLSSARISPQERLRTRMVFEIAAALPILLQVSLGLFFMSLCFFTTAVDH